jgi:hypothetical protein
MPLNWKPTIPEDNDLADLTGCLCHYPFARVRPIQSGPDQGKFRWYLNDLPGATAIRKQGVEDNLDLAKAAADEQFQSWLDWVGLIPAPTVTEVKQAPSSSAAASPTKPQPIAPPEQRLPRYLVPLCDGLTQYFLETGPALDDLYTWAIPAVPEFLSFEQGSDSLAKANFRLKRSLSAVWHAQPDRHYDLANWYVAKWAVCRATRRRRSEPTSLSPKTNWQAGVPVAWPPGRKSSSSGTRIGTPFSMLGSRWP